MSRSEPKGAFTRLSTPLIADACVRLEVPFDLPPAGVAPLIPKCRIAGPALPVRHYGSVDVFFEAMETAKGGEFLVIDNGGRADEGCIGDLTAIEAHAAGVAALFVWGAHRDTADLLDVGLPVFSYGRCPVGPLKARRREADATDQAHVGKALVGRDHWVFADDDGVLFVPGAQVERVITVAGEVRDTERRQAALVAEGETLRDQLRFGAYLSRRSQDPEYTFRDHLRNLGGAIEE